MKQEFCIGGNADELVEFDALPEFEDYTAKVFRRHTGKMYAEVVHETDDASEFVGATAPKVSMETVIEDARKKIAEHSRKAGR